MVDIILAITAVSLLFAVFSAFERLVPGQMLDRLCDKMFGGDNDE